MIRGSYGSGHTKKKKKININKYYKLTISISLLETLKKPNCTTGLKLILN